MCATIRLILILQPLFHIFPQNFPLRSHAPWCFSSCLRMVYQNELRKSGRPRKPGQSSKTNHLLRILRLTESLLQESANQRLPGTTNETASRPAERTTEGRCLFAPYSRPPVAHELSRNQRNSSSSASFVSSSRKRNWKGNQKAKKMWTHDLFCLPERSDKYPPSQRYRLECVEAGLGRKKSIVNQNGDAKHVAE